MELKGWIWRVFVVLSFGVFTKIFSPLHLRENQRASFFVNRSNSWFSRTMSLEGTLHSPPMPFIHAPFTWAYHFE